MKFTSSLLIYSLLLGTAGCEYNLNITEPSVTSTNTNTNSNTGTNQQSQATPSSNPSSQTQSGDGTNSTTLPLPMYGESIVRQVAASNPVLFNSSCPDVLGEPGWRFLDLVIRTLRAQDNRWGYLCKDDSCVTYSHDVIAYRASTSNTGIWLVDIIGDVCGAAPFIAYQVLPFDTVRKWSPNRTTGIF